MLQNMVKHPKYSMIQISHCQLKKYFLPTKIPIKTWRVATYLPNGFQLWIDFDKPPLFDPNPLVGQPTVNTSNAKLRARDITYFRATQNVFNTLANKHRHWYSAIHDKFAYDIGLWLIGAPYILYMVTVYCDRFLPSSGPHSSFRVGFYIYGIGVGLMLYRLLYSYLRWAFPVNVLKENKDTATKHRTFFAAIVTAMKAAGTSDRASARSWLCGRPNWRTYRCRGCRDCREDPR